MFSLLLIYPIGKIFSNLAKKHNKSISLYSVWGVAFYYIGATLGFIFLSYFISFPRHYSFLSKNLSPIPFGILMSWIFYLFLKKRWKKLIPRDADLLDDVFLP